MNLERVAAIIAANNITDVEKSVLISFYANGVETAVVKSVSAAVKVPKKAVVLDDDDDDDDVPVKKSVKKVPEKPKKESEHTPFTQNPANGKSGLQEDALAVILEFGKNKFTRKEYLDAVKAKDKKRMKAKGAELKQLDASISSIFPRRINERAEAKGIKIQLVETKTGSNIWRNAKGK